MLNCPNCGKRGITRNRTCRYCQSAYTEAELPSVPARQVKVSWPWEVAKAWADLRGQSTEDGIPLQGLALKQAKLAIEKVGGPAEVLALIEATKRGIIWSRGAETGNSVAAIFHCSPSLWDQWVAYRDNAPARWLEAEYTAWKSLTTGKWREQNGRQILQAE